MKEIRYVLADPTGNLTCLVLDPVAMEDRPAVTARLMEKCEQVGYLREARREDTVLRLEMMGGEFCGNASMSAAALLAREIDPDPGEILNLPLEVSGAGGVVPCQITRTAEGDWRGAVRMPLPTGMAPCEVAGIPLTAVFMPGIAHLFYEGEPLGREAAEHLMEAAKAAFPEMPAIGLMQYDDSRPRMTPLVWVRDSDTMVWENACGSGTTAAVWWQGMKNGCSTCLTVTQPGGDLRAEADWEGDGIACIRLIGHVRLGPEEILEI